VKCSEVVLHKQVATVMAATGRIVSTETDLSYSPAGANLMMVTWAYANRINCLRTFHCVLLYDLHYK